MTVEHAPDGTKPRGRIEQTADRRQPVALRDDDGRRLTVYDGWLRVVAARTGSMREVVIVAGCLLRWQRHNWGLDRYELEDDPRVELAMATAALLPSVGDDTARAFARYVSDFLDHAESEAHLRLAWADLPDTWQDALASGVAGGAVLAPLADDAAEKDEPCSWTCMVCRPRTWDPISW